jgi:hypothetical protein
LVVIESQLVDEEDVGKIARPLVRTLLAQVLRTGVELLGHLVADGEEGNCVCAGEPDRVEAGQSVGWQD